MKPNKYLILGIVTSMLLAGCGTIWPTAGPTYQVVRGQHEAYATDYVDNAVYSLRKDTFVERRHSKDMLDLLPDLVLEAGIRTEPELITTLPAGSKVRLKELRGISNFEMGVRVYPLILIEDQGYGQLGLVDATGISRKPAGPAVGMMVDPEYLELVETPPTRPGDGK